MTAGAHPHARGVGLTSPVTRAKLVAELRREGIVDERVLGAIQKIPRHQFVEESWAGEAYKNRALPIGQAQTISQPHVVALMTQSLLDGEPVRKHVLEIGTGSGYQTAVLAELVTKVFSVERIKTLTETARERLKLLGYRNIHFGYNDGTLGWAAHGPYDGIVVTAASLDVPKALIDQLVVGGRLVIPVGPPADQMLRVIDRTPRGVVSREIAHVSFVPLLGGRA